VPILNFSRKTPDGSALWDEDGLVSCDLTSYIGDLGRTMSNLPVSGRISLHRMVLGACGPSTVSGLAVAARRTSRIGRRPEAQQHLGRRTCLAGFQAERDGGGASSRRETTPSLR
jgi:hypothetical protein